MVNWNSPKDVVLFIVTTCIVITFLDLTSPILKLILNLISKILARNLLPLLGIEDLKMGEDFSVPLFIANTLNAIKDNFMVVYMFVLSQVDRPLIILTVILLAVLFCMFIVYYVCVHMLPNDFPFFIQNIVTSIISNIVPFSWFWGEFGSFDNFIHQSPSQQTTTAGWFIVSLLQAPFAWVDGMVRRYMPTINLFINQGHAEAKSRFQPEALDKRLKRCTSPSSSTSPLDVLKARLSLLNCQLDNVRSHLIETERAPSSVFKMCDEAHYPEEESRTSKNGVPYVAKLNAGDTELSKIRCKLSTLENLVPRQ